MVEQFDRKAFLEKIEEKKGVIILHSLFNKEAKALCEPTKDVRGKFYGLREDPSEAEKAKGGTFLTRKDNIELYHGIDFDLSNENDRAYWDMVKYSPLVAYKMEEAQYIRAARFVIYVEESIAEAKVDKKLLRNKAENLIIADTTENLRNRLKVLGIKMTGTDLIIKDVMMDMADTNPSKIIALYDASIGVHLLIYKAIDENIIFLNKDKFYQVANTLMGTDIESVVSYLNKDKNSDLLEYVRDAIEGTGDEKPVIKMGKPELVKYLEDNIKVKEGEDRLEYSDLSRGDLQKLVTAFRKTNKK